MTLNIQDLPIQHYSPKAGDVLVVSVPYEIDQDEADNLRRQARSLIRADVDILIKQPGISIEVLRQE